MTDNYWKNQTIKSIQRMFDNRIEYNAVAALFEENESDVEKTIDELLTLLSKESPSVSNSTREGQQESQEELSELAQDAQLQESNIEVPYTFDAFRSSTSVLEESEAQSSGFETQKEQTLIDFTSLLISETHTQTEISLLQSNAEEKDIQTDLTQSELPADLKFFRDRIDELSTQLSELSSSKERVEEEKKNAMRWCLVEMQKLKEESEQKDGTIAKQQLEIEELKRKLQEQTNTTQTTSTNEKDEENKNSPLNAKFDTFIQDSKQVIVDGVQSISREIAESFTRVQQEFRKGEDHELLERLRQFASEFKKDITELFNDSVQKTVPQKSSASVPAVKSAQEYEDQIQILNAEKASLESYVAELENRIKNADHSRLVD